MKKHYIIEYVLNSQNGNTIQHITKLYLCTGFSKADTKKLGIQWNFFAEGKLKYDNFATKHSYAKNESM